MTTHAGTRSHLLRAIAAHPDEDQPRLEFADWLDEQEPVRAKCPRCEGEKVASAPLGLFEVDKSGWIACPTCHGSGTVTDDTDRKWAELIRVQYELERGYKRLGLDPLADTPEFYPLEERNEELLRTLGPVLRRGAKCGRCEDGQVPSYTGMYRLGSDPCKQCHVGWLGSLAERENIYHTEHGQYDETGWLDHIPRWRCGFPDEWTGTLERFTRLVRIGPFISQGGGMSVADGVPWAATLFREWPITGVVLSDREPANTRPGRWTWFGPHPTERHETDEARLPGFLWVLLKHVDYDTREAALSALSAVCVAWARQQAGLPPLGKRG